MDESGGVAWRKRRVNRMLVEYFLRAGYYNTALKLARQMGIEVSDDQCPKTALERGGDYSPESKIVHNRQIPFSSPVTALMIDAGNRHEISRI